MIQLNSTPDTTRVDGCNYVYYMYQKETKTDCEIFSRTFNEDLVETDITWN